MEKRRREALGEDGRAAEDLQTAEIFSGAVGAAGAASACLAAEPCGGAIALFVARQGFSQLRQYADRAFEAIRSSSRSGTRTTQYRAEGGSSGARRLFDRLTGGRSGATRDGGRLGELRDGTKVQISSKVRDDGTVETSVRISSQRPGSRIRDVVKIRYEDPPPKPN